MLINWSINKVYKWFLRLVFLLLSVWLLGALYLRSQAAKMIFHPQVSWAPIPQYNYQLEFLRNNRGQAISIWFFQNPNSTQYILYLHGNTGRLAHFFPELLKKGNVISPAYPGYHESEGDPSVDNVYETALLTYTWLVRDKKIPEKQIIIFGHSLGGSPAVYLASQKPTAKKLVLVNTFSSIQSMCWRVYTLWCLFAKDLFNSAKYASQVTIPVRQFAYQMDQTVPFEEGQKLHEYFKASSDKKFVRMTQTTHSYPDFSLILPELED